MRMKQKMIEKGKVSASESEGSGDDEFAEFMRWKQQKRRAARRGYDDWDQDDWGGPPKDTRPVNRSSSSGYSSGYNRIGFSTLRFSQCVFSKLHSCAFEHNFSEQRVNSNRFENADD